MSFSVFESNIVLCNSESVLIYNYETKCESIIELPKLIINKDLKLHNNVDVDLCHGITSITFSDDGQYFCVCTNRKQLCVYNRKDCSLHSNRTLVRAASKIRFTPTNDIVIADKSGDAYIYPVRKCTEADEEKLILGHLSMLLDILVTADNKYIISADRDEKIRVSHFPNAYNIKSYCIGHANFVNNICQLPHDNDILVSAGGDGFLKFWDYKNGRELLSVSYTKRINADDVKTLNTKLQESEIIDTILTLPVKHLRLSQRNDNTSICALSFYGSKNILFYNISGNSTNELDVHFLQILSEDTEPLECQWQKQKFWILFDCGLKLYKLQENCFVKDSSIDDILQKLNDTWKMLACKMNQPNFYPILYKRKFDAVQEYQERKKSRLNNTVK